MRVQRVTAAVDAGQIINPDGLKNQIEGGIIQGASWTLKEQVKFDRQQITSRDWAGYPILTFEEVPESGSYADRSPRIAPVGCWRSLAGTDLGGDRQRDLPRDRRATARSALHGQTRSNPHWAERWRGCDTKMR